MFLILRQNKDILDFNLIDFRLDELSHCGCCLQTKLFEEWERFCCT